MPDWSQSSREIITLPLLQHEHGGYDAWVQQYHRAEEINLVSSIIQSVANNPRPVHIAGISCAESIDLTGEYYQQQ